MVTTAGRQAQVTIAEQTIRHLARCLASVDKGELPVRHAKLVTELERARKILRTAQSQLLLSQNESLSLSEGEPKC